MGAKQLCLVMLVLLLVVGCQQAEVGTDKSALPADEATSEAKLDAQLEINRNALLEGPSEQIRVKAATVMLFSEDSVARRILLEVLKQSENSAARGAVCKALSQTGAQQRVVRAKDNFIQPLFEILATEVGAEARLAAEATLIFEYEQVSGPLEKILTDRSLPTQARLNAVYALKLQPDMRAIIRLIKLLDDEPKSQVAEASEKALWSQGIPMGRDAESRRQIIDGLKRKGRDEFLRDWLIRQEAKMRELETELNLWRRLYLAALGKIYDGISDDTEKGKFLASHLVDSKASVRLWALEKVSQWRHGTKSKLSAELGPVLVSLVSDRNREVRLRTARLLALMVELDSTQRLLEQLKIEQDDEVKTELFVALGGACYYAFLPNSGIKISPAVRKQTLELAAEYLSEQEPKKAQKGAEVIKKLLEQDGLTSSEVDRYLGLLAQKYNQQKDESDGALRGELLNAMAGLCAQSVYKSESAGQFGPLFEEALRDETDLVREAAVDGLVYIDKARALKTLRRDLINDSSVIVRKKLIGLAGEVGGEEDLLWLAEKIGTAAENELAWQAMLKIFRRCDAGVLGEWVARLNSQSNKVGLSDEQRISFLETAERKAVGENKLKMLKGVREELARLYGRNGRFEKAAEYFGMLRGVAESMEEKERISAELLDVYLRWPNVERASRLVEHCLLEKDLEPNNVIVRSLDNYLSAPSGGADPNSVLKALSEMPADGREMWAEQLKRWLADHLGQPEGLERSEK